MDSVEAVVEKVPLRARVAGVIPALRVFGFVAAVGLVVYMGIHAAGEVDTSHLAWWPMPLAFAFAAGWWLLLARGWALLVHGRPGRSDVSVWCRTQALRYLPGGFWAPAARVAVVHGTPLDRITTVAAENVLALCAALSIGAAALVVDGRVWAAPAIALAAAPVVASRFLASRTRVEPGRTGRATWNYLTAFAGYAVCAVLVQTAVSGFHDVAAIVGAATIAWGAGLVVVIAPGGVGVREVVYVALASAALPDAELTAAAVTMRVLMILAELAVLVVAGRPTPDPVTERLVR